MESSNATQTNHHSRQSAVLILDEMKKSLSELEMIEGESVMIVGGVSSWRGIVGGDGGGPVYITGGQKELSFDSISRHSLSSRQGKGSNSLFNSASVGQWKSPTPTLR